MRNDGVFQSCRKKVDAFGKKMINRKEDPIVRTHWGVLFSHEKMVGKCCTSNSQTTEGNLMSMDDVR